MPACCPLGFLGYDWATKRYKYHCMICGSNPPQTRFCYTLLAVRTGGCGPQGCTVATITCDDLELPVPNPEDPLEKIVKPGLMRRVYRRLVPHPENPDNGPDVPFVAGPKAMIVAEYTAEYKAKGKAYLARLMHVAVPDVPGAICGLGWELDPRSPLSPLPTPHFAGDWITKVTVKGLFHIIEIQKLGEFRISIVREKG